MTDPTNNQPQAAPAPDAQPPKETKRRKKSLWVRLIKWALISIIGLLLLIAGCISLVVWTLTPDRLTPLINKYASEYLIADVDAKRVELTFWSTFPHLSVQVDSLQVNSRALHSLPDSVRSTLPADADSLLFLKKFAGGLNITSLIAGNIELYNVDFHDIRANLVQVDSLAANYLIVPPTEDTDTVKTDTGLPSIALDRFLIADGMNARFRNITDSLDCTLRLKQLNLTDLKQSKPLYSFTTEGDAAAVMPWIKVPETPFSINGKIAWESSAPMVVGLSDFSIGVGDVTANFTTSIDMSTDFIIKEFSANVPRVQLSKVLAVVPDQFKAPLKPLDTDLSLEMSAKILKPYNLASKELPVIDASIKTDAKRLKFDKLQLSLLELDADAHIDCNKPDASVIDIKRVAARGRAIDFSLSALVTTPVSDPNIEGSFDGTVTFQNLPSQLLSSLPCAIRGSLHGTARVITRLSYLDPKRFHRAKIDGTLTLDNFHMAMTDGSLDAFLNRAEFKLGSSSQITVQDHVVDSMLTASLSIDTVALSSPGVVLSGSKLAANVGSRNIASSSDTSQINPIGANITAARLMLKSDSDSVRIRLRDAQIAASLQRYESQARSPLLKSLVKARSMRFADRFNRLSLREAEANFTAHPKARPQMSARRQAIFDSIASAHPELSTDSIRGLMRAGFKKGYKPTTTNAKGAKTFTSTSTTPCTRFCDSGMPTGR